jgi:ribosomal protein RSM22 (predicted rRNA methylase)
MIRPLTVAARRLVRNDEASYAFAPPVSPWKTLLETPARAAWRVSSPQLPEHWETARVLLLNQARQNDAKTATLPRPYSLKQLRACQSLLVTAHGRLAQRRDKERLQWLRGETVDSKNKNIVVTTTGQRKERASWKQGHSNKRGVVVDPVFYGPAQVLAALQYRMHPNYSVTFRVLQECKSLLTEKWYPRRIIDFGIGCGSASAAAIDAWQDSGKIEWIHGIDPSLTARDCAQKMLQNGLSNLQSGQDGPRITMSAHLSSSSSTAAPSLPTTSGFDLALYCYTATELPHLPASLAAAALLWEKLRPGGILVMIEPGTPDGFANIRMVRNMLLDCSPPNIERREKHDERANDDDEDHRRVTVPPDECHILAPCTHNGKCPIERFARPGTAIQSFDSVDTDKHSDAEDDNDDKENAADDRQEVQNPPPPDSFQGFCSFVQTMPGGTNKGEKFSYMVAQKRTRGSVETNVPQFNVVDLLVQTATARNESQHGRLLQRALQLEAKILESDHDDLGLEVVRGDQNRSLFGRILKAPIKRKGHVLIDSCVKDPTNGQGRIIRRTVSKSISNLVPGIYAAARKSRWGGFWPNIDR